MYDASTALKVDPLGAFIGENWALPGCLSKSQSILRYLLGPRSKFMVTINVALVMSYVMILWNSYPSDSEEDNRTKLNGDQSKFKLLKFHVYLSFINILKE